MKYLFITLLLLIGLPAFGQSTWRNFFTTNQTPIVDVLAGSNVTVIPTLTGVNQRHFIVSANPTNLFVTNAYVTNLYAISSYVLYQTNINLYSSNAYITNLYAETITNVTIRTVDLTAHKGSVINLYSGDATFTNGIYFQTNYWAGPTNTIDLRQADQYYATYTPLSITGFVNKSNSVSESVVLTITNAASTNVSLYFPAGIAPTNLMGGTVITNATSSIFSIRYHPLAGTNAMTKSFGG